MTLDPDVCYRAIASRDRRFEGRFVVAVRTTSIYCRPGCPAPIPKRANTSFFVCAAAAEEAGFRACRRCRPDAAPDTPAVRGTSATVARAMRLLADGALDGRAGSSALAATLGIGPRHLRRLFATHLGASPITVALSRRVHFARRLLDDTALPITEVAALAGFGSVRRFNDAFQRTFCLSPSEARGRRAPASAPPGAPSELTLRLPYKPPFDWASLIAFLAARALPGVEAVEPARYLRTVSTVEGAQGWIEVRPAPRGEAALLLAVRLDRPVSLLPLVERVRRLFDLAADPLPIAAQLRRDPRLAPSLRARPGLRVPGAFCGFELAVRALLGQQISVAAATTIAGRVVERFGAPLAFATPAPLARLFPSPDRLAAAPPDALGLPTVRGEAVRALAAATAKGRITFGAATPTDETLARLTALPGVGPWTAQYIAMRALGEPDAFPSTDLVLRTTLATRAATAAQIEALAEPWRPFRAYAAMHLWRMSR